MDEETKKQYEEYKAKKDSKGRIGFAQMASNFTILALSFGFLSVFTYCANIGIPVPTSNVNIFIIVSAIMAVYSIIIIAPVYLVVQVILYLFNHEMRNMPLLASSFEGLMWFYKNVKKYYLKSTLLISSVIFIIIFFVSINPDIYSHEGFFAIVRDSIIPNHTGYDVPFSNPYYWLSLVLISLGLAVLIRFSTIIVYVYSFGLALKSHQTPIGPPKLRGVTFPRGGHLLFSIILFLVVMYAISPFSEKISEMALASAKLGAFSSRITAKQASELGVMGLVNSLVKTVNISDVRVNLVFLMKYSDGYAAKIKVIGLSKGKVRRKIVLESDNLFILDSVLRKIHLIPTGRMVGV